MAPERRRCGWVTADPLYLRYHDEEWGRPVHDDRTLFEFLVLEGAQAGLSWLTILKRREGYRSAFEGFDPRKIAQYDAVKVRRLLADRGIIRNRLKVRSAIDNARAFLKVQDELGSFDRYIWDFVGGKPVVNRFRTLDQIPARTAISDRISADLRGRGFSFVGSTIVYAHMQATGMVNDHLVGCFRHRELAGKSGGPGYRPLTSGRASSGSRPPRV